MNELQQQITKLGACEDAVAWCAGKTLSVAWHDCDRADWMFWLLVQMAGEDGWPSAQQICLAGIACGRLSLDYAGDLVGTLSYVFDIAETCVQNPTPENISAVWSARNVARIVAQDSAAVGNCAQSAVAWSAENSAHSAAQSVKSVDSSAASRTAAHIVAWSAAQSIAWSAESAAWRAVRSADSVAHSAAWSAAWRAAWRAAECAALLKMADIVRRLLTIPASLHGF